MFPPLLLLLLSPSLIFLLPPSLSSPSPPNRLVTISFVLPFPFQFPGESLCFFPIPPTLRIRSLPVPPARTTALPQWGYQRTWGNLRGTRNKVLLNAHCISETCSSPWENPSTLSALVYQRDPRPLQCGYPPNTRSAREADNMGSVRDNDRHGHRHEGRWVRFRRDLNTCAHSAGISVPCRVMALSTPPGRWR